MKFVGNRLKKLLAVASVAFMTTAFAGCGDESAGGSSVADVQNTDANLVVVGVNFEMTGNQANYGNAAKEGLELALKESNDAGGVNGKTFKIVEADTKSEAAESVNAATKLISEDHVNVIVGPAVTANVIAESQVATDSKIPVIAPAATNPDVTVENGKVKPYIFRSCFIDPQQGSVMAKFAATELNAKTAVMYLDSSSDYSKSLGTVFKGTFESAGGQVLMEEAFLAKDQDFKAALTKLKTANADVMFVPAYYEEVGKIVKQARELGIESVILGTDGWDDPKVIDIAGAPALNNTYFCTHYFDGDDEVQPFVQAYSNEYGHSPNVFSALGYDAGKMLIDAVKRSDSNNGEKIRDALETTKDLQVGTGVITVDANHNPIKGTVILATTDGMRSVRAKIAPDAPQQ